MFIIKVSSLLFVLSLTGCIYSSISKNIREMVQDQNTTPGTSNYINSNPEMTKHLKNCWDLQKNWNARIDNMTTIYENTNKTIVKLRHDIIKVKQFLRNTTDQQSRDFNDLQEKAANVTSKNSQLLQEMNTLKQNVKNIQNMRKSRTSTTTTTTTTTTRPTPVQSHRSEGIPQTVGKIENNTGMHFSNATEEINN